jgi:hypothetical protein
MEPVRFTKILAQATPRVALPSWQAQDLLIEAWDRGSRITSLSICGCLKLTLRNRRGMQEKGGASGASFDRR